MQFNELPFNSDDMVAGLQPWIECESPTHDAAAVDRMIDLASYDLAASGLAYLLATQDTRHGGTFWGLTELMGALDSQFVCCSGQMIDAILSGEADIAYNVIGSYARQRLSAPRQLRSLQPPP